LVVIYPAIAYLPIFISRALIQFNPKQLLDTIFYDKYVSEYSNVPFSAIKELQRIFSNTSVEVIYDKSN